MPRIYLILFAPPRFRASASVTDQRAAFATGVPPYIYAFHRYMEFHSPLISVQLPKRTMVGHSLQTYLTACARFTRPINRITGPTYYRGCWHVVSRLVVTVTVISAFSHSFFSLRRFRLYDPKTFFTSRCSVRLPSQKFPAFRVWAVSQSTQCVITLRSAMYRCLGTSPTS